MGPRPATKWAYKPSCLQKRDDLRRIGTKGFFNGSWSRRSRETVKLGLLRGFLRWRREEERSWRGGERGGEAESIWGKFCRGYRGLHGDRSATTIAAGRENAPKGNEWPSSFFQIIRQSEDFGESKTASSAGGDRPLGGAGRKKMLLEGGEKGGPCASSRQVPSLHRKKEIRKKRIHFLQPKKMPARASGRKTRRRDGVKSRTGRNAKQGTRKVREVGKER